MVTEPPTADSVEYQACYVWTPDGASLPAKRAAKRRRITTSSVHSNQPECISTVPLLLGHEAHENVSSRSAMLEESWHAQEQGINEVFESTTADTISQVANFILHSDQTRTETTIPTAFLVAGPSNSTYTNIVRSVEAQLQEILDVAIVNIIPSQIVNLKSAIKFINNQVTDAVLTIEEDDMSKHEQSSRRLNYDLQILGDHVRFHSTAKIILAFHDSETLDGSLLNDIIEVISSWYDRIPFVCLFGIKTSVELFQEKLHRTTIQRLHGAQFEVAQVDVDSVFRAVSSSHWDKVFWLGPGIIYSIIQAQQNYIQSIASFTRSLQYAHMTHIFANPLSVLLKDPLPAQTFQKELYEYVRNLDSFRQHVEDLIAQKDFDRAKNLLHDNSVLHKEVEQGIKKSKIAMKSLILAVELFTSIQKSLNNSATEPWCNLYIKAMAGQLKDSAIVKDTLLAVRKLPSDAMTTLLADLAESPLPDMLVLHNEVRQLQSDCEGTEPLRSKHDTNYAGLRTTIVSHKVQLSKQSAALSKQDLLYSNIVDRVDGILVKYLQETLITPQELFLHEILIYDFKSPHREVFAPKPRHAMERALSSPGDYLGCSCCSGTQRGLSATHPVTSILYQLFLESGAIINTSDLWSAFNTIIESEDNDDEDAEQERTLALFSQALAELKYMSMITSSRKKADHLAKVLWNGL
ncbi:Origin recognition complex subunit 3 [Xanthoria calcicola]